MSPHGHGQALCTIEWDFEARSPTSTLVRELLFRKFISLKLIQLDTFLIFLRLQLTSVSSQESFGRWSLSIDAPGWLENNAGGEKHLPVGRFVPAQVRVAFSW